MAPGGAPGANSIDCGRKRQDSQTVFEVQTVIKKTAAGYLVLSHDGKKKLGGPYQTRAEALKRLRQVEFFKRKRS